MVGLLVWGALVGVAFRLPLVALVFLGWAELVVML